MLTHAGMTSRSLWSRPRYCDGVSPTISVKRELNDPREVQPTAKQVSVTDACVAVGCTSLGSFSSRFTEIVGETPSQYRARDHRDLEVVPSCMAMIVTRPRRTPAKI